MEKWLFFDLGYTLLDESDAHKARIEALIQNQAKLGKVLTYRQVYSEMCKAATEYRPQFYGAMERLGIEEKIPYPKEYEKPYPDAATMLETLSRDYHIGVIANQSAGSESRLKAMGLLKYIEIGVYSAEAGVSKPDPEIFRLAFDRSGCLPENACMIGDRLDNDIYPAKKAGMETIWIKQGFGGMMKPLSEEYEPVAQANSLKELPKILQNIFNV